MLIRMNAVVTSVSLVAIVVYGASTSQAQSRGPRSTRPVGPAATNMSYRMPTLQQPAYQPAQQQYYQPPVVNPFLPPPSYNPYTPPAYYPVYAPPAYVPTPSMATGLKIDENIWKKFDQGDSGRNQPLKTTETTLKGKSQPAPYGGVSFLPSENGRSRPMEAYAADGVKRTAGAVGNALSNGGRSLGKVFGR